MKYIIGTKDDARHVIIFDDGMPHKKAAEAFDRITSAGFITLTSKHTGKMHVTCHGESISLGIKSKGLRDAFVVETVLFGGFTNYTDQT